MTSQGLAFAVIFICGVTVAAVLFGFWAFNAFDLVPPNVSFPFVLAVAALLLMAFLAFLIVCSLLGRGSDS